MSSIEQIYSALQSNDAAALAVISAVDGPSYRPLGAMMAIGADGATLGMLSSGCIEADVVDHALKALKSERPKQLLYGRGSPFFDIQLPCGGGLEITILPRPDLAVLADIVAHRKDRKTTTLQIDLKTGHMALCADGATTRSEDGLSICFESKLQFLVFGKGPEATTFTALLAASGYQHVLISHDPETIERAMSQGCTASHSPNVQLPTDLQIDARTSITLFFHDHEYEPGILKQALGTDAFYIGAQGSKRAREKRDLALAELGLTPPFDRIRGPIGLIPSTRDPRTLSVSVLAEILAMVTPGNVA